MRLKKTIVTDEDKAAIAAFRGKVRTIPQGAVANPQIRQRRFGNSEPTAEWSSFDQIHDPKLLAHLLSHARRKCRSKKGPDEKLRDRLEIEDEAKDLVHETIVKAIANRASFFEGTNLAGWLYKILENTFLDSIEKKRECRDIDDAALNRIAITPDNSYDWMPEIGAALQKLSPDHRRAIIEVDFLGRTIDEASASIGIPRGTLSTNLRRGRAQFQLELVEIRRSK